MSEKNLLWHLLKATTKSKTDVWKEFHLHNHERASRQLIGKPKRRFTVPVLVLGKTQWDSSIFLLIQFSSYNPKLKSFKMFEISSKVFTHAMDIEVQYVYMTNTRIGDFSEFITGSNGEIIDYGEIKENARNSILNKAIEIIKDTPREKLIKDIRNHKYSHFNRAEWDNLIVVDQFTNEEQKFRGILKKKQ